MKTREAAAWVGGHCSCGKSVILCEGGEIFRWLQEMESRKDQGNENNGSWRSEGLEKDAQKDAAKNNLLEERGCDGGTDGLLPGRCPGHGVPKREPSQREHEPARAN